MPSQFFGLNIAASGLRTYNAALNTTANNIANTQTVGYSRQIVVQEANDALRTFATYGCAGAGVDVIAIERARNHFYDVKYWNNANRLGRHEVQAYYMRSLEDYFEDDNISGFKTLFNLMSNALQSVTSNSSSASSKAAFVSSLKAMTDYFNNMYGNLQEMQKDLNLEIKQTADEINSIAEKIAVLNKQINVIEMGGPTANQLRDQRDKLIDQLSLLVDVKVDEYPIHDPNDPTRITGANHYSVSINGGQTLVNGNDYNQLVCVARKGHEKVNQTDIDGLYDIKWANGNSFGLDSAALGGKLRGLVELRDGNNGFHFNGRLNEIGTTTYTDANGVTKLTSTVTIGIKDVSLLDMKLCNLSDTGGKIVIGGQIYYYQDWQYNNDGTYVNGIYQNDGTYTLILDDEKCDQIINTSKLGTEASIGGAVNYQGVPYFMTQMNAWIRGFAEKVNGILHGDYTQATDAAGNLLFDANGDPILDFSANGFDVNGDPGAFVFTGTINGGVRAGEQYTGAELVAGFGRGLYNLTAGNISINEELIKAADRLGSKSTSEIGVEEFAQITEMIKLLDSKEMFSFRNGTAKDFMEILLGDVALNAGNANTFYDTYKGLSNSIDNQRNSVSGVDEDEEAVNLVKFQNAYNLSSRMIQALSEIYNRLILQTGV